MNITVSNTNSNGKNKTAVKVYVDGSLIAEVNPPKRNPLQYIRDHDGQYRKSLVEQCTNAGLSNCKIKEVLGI